MLVSRPQLRLGLLARARAVGAAAVRLSRRDRAELRRHLPQQLLSERAAAGGSCPRTWCGSCWTAPSRSQGTRSRSTSNNQTVADERDTLAQFDIDPSVKHRLLNGLDDIGLTLQHAARSTPSSRRGASICPRTTTTTTSAGGGSRMRLLLLVLAVAGGAACWWRQRSAGSADGWVVSRRRWRRRRRAAQARVAR